jgi:signal transduction histidine kinase
MEKGCENTAQQDLHFKLQSGLRIFSDVVDEILDVARLDSEAAPLNLQSVPLVPLFQRIDAMFYELAKAKCLSLIIRMPKDAQACIWTDPALLWRVLSNLVSNAVRYTDHGTVLIAARLGAAGSKDSRNPLGVFTGDISLARAKVESRDWHFVTKPVRPEVLMEWLTKQALKPTPLNGK